MQNEFVFIYAYDAGYNISRRQLDSVLQNLRSPKLSNYVKPEPAEVAPFYAPQILDLGTENIEIKGKNYKFTLQAAFFSFGAVSIRAKYTFNKFHKSTITLFAFNPEMSAKLNLMVYNAKRKINDKLKSVKSFEGSKFYENYKFYYISGNKQEIMKNHKKLVAGLLVNEADYESIDEAYVDSILARKIEYDKNNFLAVGWESAFMIDKDYSHEHEFSIAELSNIQLLEMRIYHSKLLEQRNAALSVLSKINAVKIFNANTGQLKNLQKSLGIIYNASSSMLNEINDIVFNLGEWYLSRVYGLFSTVFRLEEWKERIDGDLESIEKEQTFATELIDTINSNILEYIVILLILIEVIIELVQIIR